MGIFDSINFNIPPSPASSRDFRLLDTPCDHLVRNEQVTGFNINSLTSTINYSGMSAIYNGFSYNTQIDPNASVIIKTQLPWVNVGTLAIYQTINTTPANPVVETFTVPSGSGISNVFNMSFPPVTNSTSAQQRIYVNPTDYRLINFNNYTLSQLYGTIQFTNVLDAGSQIDFTYLARKKLIVPVDAVSKQVNYQVLGVDENGLAIIQIYGRALASTQSSLILRYTTTLQGCTKCVGQGILNDIFFDYNGRIQQVYDFSKMLQDMFKRLFTIRGSNAFDPNEGTNVTTYIGMAKADGLVLSDLIKSDIVALIYAIRDKQNLQATTGQTISLAEQIAQVNDISVRATSPTDMQVLINVVSKSGVIQQISVPISIGTTGE